MRGDLLAAAGALLAGCAASTCPSGTSAVGSFTVSFTAVDAGDTCIVTRLADGGATNTPLVSQPSTTSLAFCAQSDGGPELYMWFYGGGATKVSYDGGAFSVSGSSTDVSGCLCALNVSETISGRVWSADGGLPSLQDDGGVAPFGGFSAQVDETFSAYQSGENCACSLPCGVHYSFSGT
jgi:hypothetical protein